MLKHRLLATTSLGFGPNHTGGMAELWPVINAAVRLRIRDLIYGWCWKFYMEPATDASIRGVSQQPEYKAWVAAEKARKARK